MLDDGKYLEDFPLHAGAMPEPSGFFETPKEADASPASGAAPLAARWAAAAADAAVVLLLVALAILCARLVTGVSPRLSGLGWAVGFLVYLSLFATVLPLVLFGKTVGMAVTELSVRPGAAGAGLPVPSALRRWIGTLATAAGAGLPLIWTARDRMAPTLADRLSGHPLSVD